MNCHFLLRKGENFVETCPFFLGVSPDRMVIRVTSSASYTYFNSKMSLNAVPRVCVSLCFPLSPPSWTARFLRPTTACCFSRRAACGGGGACALPARACGPRWGSAPSLSPSVSPRLLDRWSGGPKVTPRRSNTASSCASGAGGRASGASVLPRLASLPLSLSVSCHERERADPTPTPMHSPRLILFNADRVNV